MHENLSLEVEEIEPWLDDNEPLLEDPHQYAGGPGWGRMSSPALW